MDIKHLDVGLERISRWQKRDDVHLPKEGTVSPAFLPQYRPLDEILTRPSLDERLPMLLQPRTLDPDLLEPSVLSQTRVDVSAFFASEAMRTFGEKRALLEQAAALLATDHDLEGEVRDALAALMKG